MDISEDDTLPDDAWKDSFDKLLDQRPVLRELNIIKRNVRASFNMNSSYENSSCDTSILTKTRREAGSGCQIKPTNNLLVPSTNALGLELPQNIKDKRVYKAKLVSTPMKRNEALNPFKCVLSPIGSWHLQHFRNNVERQNLNETDKSLMSATPIDGNAVFNVEYNDHTNTPKVEVATNPLMHSLGISPLLIVREKWKNKNKKNVCFADNRLSENTSRSVNISLKEINDPQLSLKLDLNPGKWRRTINCYRRTRNCFSEKDIITETTKKQHRKGRSSIVEERPKSLATATSVAGNRKSICIRSNSTRARKSLRSTYSLDCNDFKRQLLQRCGQRRIITFDNAYNDEYLKNCCKIGEGAFGEVFVYNSNSQKTVLKIIPIEGKELINGEVQKTYEQILPEVIITMELSALNKDNHLQNKTSGFVNLQRVKCVKGVYPAHLQKLWEEYDMKKESENDHPKCFTSNQQYIVLELAFAGQDIEAFCFKNAEQSFSALQQIALTLAVGEKEYQFEHRDLHWGNILVQNTNQQSVTYKLDGETLTVPTKGIIITIIDYTLSRMTFNDYCFFNDLSNDEELFSATGDYQFEIYRMMRKILDDKWDTFEPKTNLFWISYIISKLLDGVKYKSTRSKIHLNYLDKLKKLQETILTYTSCVHCAKDIVSY